MKTWIVAPLVLAIVATGVALAQDANKKPSLRQSIKASIAELEGRLVAQETRLSRLEQAVTALTDRVAGLERRSETKAEDTSPTQRERATPPRRTPGLELVSVIASVIDKNSVLWTYSYIVKVRNNETQEVDGWVKVRWLSRDGFELSLSLAEFHLGPKEERAFTGTQRVRADSARNVRSISAECDLAPGRVVTYKVSP